ncbi:MAG: restriction endonuclease [Acidobacteriaceae bacterium]
MSFGTHPFGTVPVGTSGTELEISFDLDSPSVGHSILEVVSLFDRELIRQLSKDPDQLRTIGRRDFERLVGELFSGFGYEVELTQRTRDGGKDIIAIKRRKVEVKFLIECKRPDPGNPVAVSTVRELLGVKVDDGASKAILATTTYLSPDAKQFVDKHRWELEAREFDAIKEWITDYLSVRSR